MSEESFRYYVVYHMEGDFSQEVIVITQRSPMDNEAVIEETAEAIAAKKKTSRRVKILNWKRIS